MEPPRVNVDVRPVGTQRPVRRSDGPARGFVHAFAVTAPTLDPSHAPIDPSTSLGLADGAAEVRLFVRLAIPAALAFAIVEMLLAFVFRDLSAFFGAVGLAGFAVWAATWCLPRIGRVAMDRLVWRLALAMFVPIVMGGYLLRDAVAIATLIPLALALPYVGRRALAGLGLLAVGLAVLVAVSGEALPPDEAIPREIRTALSATAIATVFGLVALLVSQFAARLRSITHELANVIELSTQLAQTLDPREIGDLTAWYVAVAIGADECGICYWDEATDRILTYGYYPPERRTAVDESYDLADYPATRVVLERHETLIVNDTDPTADPAEVAYLRSDRPAGDGDPAAAGQGPRPGRDRGHLALAGLLRRAADPPRPDARRRGRDGPRELAPVRGAAPPGLPRQPDRAGQSRPVPGPGRAGAGAPAGRCRVGLVAVLFLDLDDFKTVNESLGHAGGDQLLAAVAERLGTCLRTSDTAARLGGDEFAILLEDVDDEAAATDVAQRIIDALRPPIRIGEAAAVIATSIGIAASPPGLDSASELLRNADFAMYQAKHGGKGRYEVFRSSLRETANERAALEGLLRGAEERDELRLHYQPVVDLADGSIVGVEALVRWEAPAAAC